VFPFTVWRAPHCCFGRRHQVPASSLQLLGVSDSLQTPRPSRSLVCAQSICLWSVDPTALNSRWAHDSCRTTKRSSQSRALWAIGRRHSAAADPGHWVVTCRAELSGFAGSPCGQRRDFDSRAGPSGQAEPAVPRRPPSRRPPAEYWVISYPLVRRASVGCEGARARSRVAVDRRTSEILCLESQVWQEGWFTRRGVLPHLPDEPALNDPPQPRAPIPRWLRFVR